MELLRVDIRTDGVVALRGELDAETAPLLIHLTGRLPADHRRLVLDLRELSFLDVAGARSLAAIAGAEPRRRVVVRSTTPYVARVLETLAEVLPPNLSVSRGFGDDPGLLHRLAALTWTPAVAETTARVRSRVARRLRRLRRLRRRLERALATSRRLRTPRSTAQPTR